MSRSKKPAKASKRVKKPVKKAAPKTAEAEGQGRREARCEEGGRAEEGGSAQEGGAGQEAARSSQAAPREGPEAAEGAQEGGRGRQADHRPGRGEAGPRLQVGLLLLQREVLRPRQAGADLPALRRRPAHAARLRRAAARRRRRAVAAQPPMARYLDEEEAPASRRPSSTRAKKKPPRSTSRRSKRPAPSSSPTTRTSSRAPLARNAGASPHPAARPARRVRCTPGRGGVRGAQQSPDVETLAASPTRRRRGTRRRPRWCRWPSTANARARERVAPATTPARRARRT